MKKKFEVKMILGGRNNSVGKTNMMKSADAN